MFANNGPAPNRLMTHCVDADAAFCQREHDIGLINIAACTGKVQRRVTTAKLTVPKKHTCAWQVAATTTKRSAITAPCGVADVSF
jgi:hypothetical protein